MVVNRKLQHFLNTIHDEAARDSNELRDEVSARRAAYMAAAEDAILTEVYDYVRTKTARIRTEAGRRVSQRTFEQKRELYDVRTSIAEEIYAEVRRRVEHYAASDEYPDALRSMARRAARELAGDGLELYLRPCDMGFADELAALARAEVKEGHIALGGLVAQNPARHLRLDLSYDAAMDTVAERFGELSDFTL